MRDIVATIQADQYRLITHDPNTPLVIQGEVEGPTSDELLRRHHIHLRQGVYDVMTCFGWRFAVGSSGSRFTVCGLRFAVRLL